MISFATSRTTGNNRPVRYKPNTAHNGQQAPCALYRNKTGPLPGGMLQVAQPERG